MRKKKSAIYKLHITYCILSFIILILLIPRFVCNTAYAEESAKHVLFISSYSYNFLSVPEQIDGLNSIFQENNIEMDIEFMDTKRFDKTEYINLFYELLKYKIDNNSISYDAVVVGDDNALQFVMNYQNELFHNIPIVFLGINDLERARLAAENDNITGIVEETSIKENIELGIKFNKNAKKVIAIVDNTLTGLGNKEQFYSYSNKFKNLSFDDINVSDYSFDELGDILEKIGDDTILMYFSMYTDKSGTILTIPEAVELLKEHTHVPIYRSEIGGIGQGILGGKMISYSKAGQIAAKMVVKALDGTPIKDIELITDSPNFYTFDYQILKQYNINKKLLPQNSILINRDISFFEAHKSVVIKIITGVFILLSFITVLVVDNIRRRKIEKELQESHEELTQTFEELSASEEELRAQYETIQDHSQELAILNQKYSIAIESTNSGVWEFDFISKDIFVSKSFIKTINQNLNGYEEVDQLLDVLLTNEVRKLLSYEVDSYRKGEKNEINIQIPVLDQVKNRKWILVRGKGVHDTKGELQLIHGILLDITKMKEQEDYIQKLASHDYLTSLPNRMQFMNLLKKEIDAGYKGAILLIDIDNFKSVNDTLGHIYGDKLLQEISTRLSNIAQQENGIFVSRFGGDEFLLMILKEEDKNVIETHIQQIIRIFDDPFVLNHKEYFVQFSIGISCYPYDSNNLDQLLMNVDTAMYSVKKNGKNNYMFYNKDMQDEIIDKANVEDILRQAIKSDGFKLVYQPQVSVKTGETISFEALLRLKEYQVSPDKFIQIAEETGLIKDIGRWVTREAIAQIACWKREMKDVKPIAINYSSKQLRDEEYITYLSDLLTEYEVESNYIEIEITESILLEKTDNTFEFLNKLKNMGVKIALDDFGTGYSSLNYLTYIPVHKIKLDKSLCEKFLSLENSKIMDSIIALAHSLNIEITAEGIEDICQFKKLKQGGCDYIQGYLFSRPLPIDDINKLYYMNFLDNL